MVEWAETIPVQGYVLDLGCGVGRHMVYLGERGFRMAGVDISPSGIQRAQKACADRQIPFQGHVSDMNALPWRDETFDAVLSISTIHHHWRAGIIRTLGEVRRVLKPGGLLLVDFPCNTFVDQRADLDEMDDGFLPHHYCDEADLRELLRSFEIVRLWASLRELKDGAGMRGKWIASARRPLSD